MSKDVELFVQELQDIMNQLRDIVRTVDNSAGEARALKLSKGQDLLKAAQRTLHNFKVEIRSSKSTGPYDKQWQDFNAQLTTFKEQLQAKKTVAAAAASVGGAAAPESGGDAVRGEAHAIGKRIADTQDATINILKRSAATVEQTKEIAEDATTTMAKQTEQMKRTNEKLDKLDSDVDRAKSEVNAFMRRMMTDKIIICFALLLLIAIIAVIVLRIQAPQVFDGSTPAGSTTTMISTTVTTTTTMMTTTITPPPTTTAMTTTGLTTTTTAPTPT